MNEYRKNPDEGAVRVKGQIDLITTRNEESGWVVARIVPDNGGMPFKIVGVIPELKEGECLEIQGHWETHEAFGEQLRVDSFKVIMPVTIKGIEIYLGSGLIPGVGPVTAKKLTRHFKNKIIYILDNEPERLKEIPGVGKKTVATIIDGWKSNKTNQNVMIFLQEHDISPRMSVKIIKEYGDSALMKLRENPYRLADDVFGVGFKKADQIAQKLGVPLNDPRRLESAIIFILKNALNDGHCFLITPEIVEYAGELLNLQTHDLEEIINGLLKQDKLKKDEDKIYLPAYFVSENRAANLIAKKLSQPPPQMDVSELERKLDVEESRAGYQLNQQQRDAVIMAMSSPVMILTGGPGTGKSTTMHFLVRVAEQSKKRVIMASPTGRAAKRLEETTGRPASTIHRLLEYHPKVPGGFQRNEENPLEGQFLIIDEASMIDLVLFYHLLKAVPREMQILFVGDPDQLPSVGAGNVLADILAVREIDRIKLTEIFRQAERSMIVQNAHQIVSGRQIITTQRDNMEHDFRFIEEDDPQRAAEIIVNIITKKFTDKIDLIRDIQVLSPMHLGAAGARNLNKIIQDELNPVMRNIDELDYYGRKFRIGDRVMQIKNNYEKDVFNGDIGFVENVDSLKEEIHVRFDRLIIYKKKDLDELFHAYAITIHKSQGSEYPIVIMPILTQHFIMLRRNLLYTGITRAKKLSVIVGSKKAVNIAIRRDDVGKRNSMLTDRIIRCMN